MEPVTIILALCIPLAFGVGWRVGASETAQLKTGVKYYRKNRDMWSKECRALNTRLADLRAAEAKRHTQRMAALAKANAANRAKRDVS